MSTLTPELIEDHAALIREAARCGDEARADILASQLFLAVVFAVAAKPHDADTFALANAMLAAVAGRRVEVPEPGEVWASREGRQLCYVASLDGAVVRYRAAHYPHAVNDRAMGADRFVATYRRQWKAAEVPGEIAAMQAAYAATRGGK